MTLREAIDTAFSHNAIVNIQEDEHNGFSHTIWKGQLHSLPEEYLDREFEPISDYVFCEKEYEAPILITLKDKEDLDMTKFDEEYLNSKIEAYGKAHPNGNKEDLELLAELRNDDSVDIGNGWFVHKAAYDCIIERAKLCVKQTWAMRDSFANNDEDFVEYFMTLMENQVWN